ncbi:MAG: cytochrome-c peroxidase [Rhodoferax sp.]
MDLKPIFTSVLRALVAAFALALAACGGGSGSDDAAGRLDPVTAADAARLPPGPGDRARLGSLIFTDGNLSEPRGTACAACHQAQQGFAGNHGSMIGVAQGSQPGSIGLRNAMTNAYAALVPAFQFVTTDGVTEAIGGMFWDGRADTLALQALGPLLNPLEMNNPDRKTVVDKIARAAYAGLFRQEFGADIFADTDAAFIQIGVAIEAFERSALQPFSSKYDAFVRGQAPLSAIETRGMALFMDAAKGNCASCHLMNPASAKPEDSLFSEFSYYATGVPRNKAIPRNADPAFFDLGLCGPERSAPALPAGVAAGLTIENFCGKFRMPTLRNVAERPAFMHNGVFKDLHEVVRFYASRNSDPQHWYGQAVSNDLPARYLANIEVEKAPFNRAASAGPALSETEVSDIVAFLRTLSDDLRAP